MPTLAANMKTSHNRWLLDQLPSWEQEGIINSDCASVLRERYAEKSEGISLVQLIFGGLGALLVGLGLIAVIGYNWDDFGRPARLLFAFLPLLGAQAFSFWVLRKGGALAPWVRESAALFQAITAGACLAVVSQIYNMGGSWPEFLFWWLVLSLPLAWVMRSHAVALFYIIGTTVWVVDQMDFFRTHGSSILLYPLLLLGLVPYWPGLRAENRLPVFSRWVLAIGSMIGLCVTIESMVNRSYGSVQFLAWMLLATAYVILPLSAAGVAEGIMRKPQTIIGGGMLIVMSFISSFGAELKFESDGAMNILLGVVVVILLALAISRRRWSELSVASLVVIPLYPEEVQKWFASLHLVGVGLALILLHLNGLRGTPRLGAMILAGVVMARMGDSNLSLLTKGFCFIAVGIGFLVFNVWLSRRNKVAA